MHRHVVLLRPDGTKSKRKKPNNRGGGRIGRNDENGGGAWEGFYTPASFPGGAVGLLRPTAVGTLAK